MVYCSSRNTLSYICRKLSKNSNIEVIGDLHFIIQKEGSLLDNFLTKRALSYMGTYITHSLKTFNELDVLFGKKHQLSDEQGNRLINKKQTINLFHPVYKLFEVDNNFDVKSFKDKIGLKQNVFLFLDSFENIRGCIMLYQHLRNYVTKGKMLAFLFVEKNFGKQ